MMKPVVDPPSKLASRLMVSVGFVLLGGAFLLQTLPAGATDGRARSAFCKSRGALSATTLPTRVSLHTCDLVGRTVAVGGLALKVPARGHGVGAAALGTAGETQLTITTSHDGIVTITTETESSESNEGLEQIEALGTGEPAPCDETGETGCLDPCTDDNYDLNPLNAKVKLKQPWFFKASSVPTATLTADQALTQIKVGTQNIVKVRNDCSMVDKVDQTAPYKGTTTRGTGITVDAGVNECADPGDAKNVVDFGKLGGNLLGLACSRYTASSLSGPWFISEADIRFNKSSLWTTQPDDPACPAQTYDLQGVVTHERGHTFGLRHTDAVTDHVPQTMYPSSRPCNGYARTLGWGDISGLNDLYN